MYCQRRLFPGHLFAPWLIVLAPCIGVAEPLTVNPGLDRAAGPASENVGAGQLGTKGDCVASSDGRLAYSTDLLGHLWAHDLSANRPTSAPLLHGISLSNAGADIATTRDGKYLLICGKAGVIEPISVVDRLSLRETATFNAGTDCGSIDTCGDGSVLITSSLSNRVLRLKIDSSGTLADSIESLSVPGPRNVYCVPGGRTGFVVTGDDHSLMSFSIPGLSPVDRRELKGSRGLAAVIANAGGRIYALSEGTIEAFEYDAVTGKFEAQAFAAMSVPALPVSPIGIESVAIDSAGSTLLLSLGGTTRRFSIPGTPVEAAPFAPSSQAAAGVCVADSLDADFDGLNELEETRLGTDPASRDTDLDGLPDGYETTHGLDPLSAGGTTNDSSSPNALAQADEQLESHRRLFISTDATVAGLSLRVRPSSATLGVTARPLLTTYHLEQVDGLPPPPLAGVRFTLTLTGSAVFGTSATEGLLLAGGGTNRALVEFVNGAVAIDIFDPTPETIQLGGQDTEMLGLEIVSDVVEDFERDAGGFSSAGKAWQHGIPMSGPKAAVSGVRVWATNLTGTYPNSSFSELLSPQYSLPPGRRPILEFQTWFHSQTCCDFGRVLITANGGASWSVLQAFSGFKGGYARAAYDLQNYVGSTVQFSFSFSADPDVSFPGWYVDDFVVRNIANITRVVFLDALADEDGDGLSNDEESTLGTDPRKPDSDGDGIIDPADNCRLTANPNQIDSVHLNGIGDACDDPDADGVYDQTDNCPDAHNASQSNLDGDLVGDACDPYPALDLMVRPISLDFGVLTRPIRVLFQLEDSAGVPLPSLAGVQVTLNLSGAAKFGPVASTGILHAGGGTSRALVEFVGGQVALDVVDLAPETVAIIGEDSEGIGIRLDGGILEDFEKGDGTFTHSGTNDVWEFGTPTSGPEAAFSGNHVWATNLDGSYPNWSFFQLVTPEYRLPAGPQPRLEFRSWFEAAPNDRGFVEVSTNYGLTWTQLGTLTGVMGGYSMSSYSLNSLAGSAARFRFRLSMNPVDVRDGWYIDDFALRGLAAQVEFLVPGDDPDNDGLTNEQEFTKGSDPHRNDTDGDLVSDAQDNCPRIPNVDQSDLVHPNVFGDACDDIDDDGVVDLTDNCPDIANGNQANADKDRLGDVCDPFPLTDLRVNVMGLDVGVTSRPLNLTFRLEDGEGQPQTGLEGVKVELTSSGSAVFGATATHGRLLQGGGTNRVRVEFVDGVVVLPVLNTNPETVLLDGTDIDDLGLRMTRDVFEDFERNDGGFTHTGNDVDIWQHGVPIAGPRAAFSGTKLWATGLDGQFPLDYYFQLVTPDYFLPSVKSPRLEFESWFDLGGTGAVEASRDGGRSWWTLDLISGVHDAFAAKSYDLKAFIGSHVRFRFGFDVDLVFKPSYGWYIDDFAVRGLSKRLEFLDPSRDEDGDGFSNEREFDIESDPHDADTDDDLKNDGLDNCPLVANPAQVDDIHPGGAGDACDDPDGDRVVDLSDNCPDASNPGQEDFLHPNGTGDACDDPDSDGLPDSSDTCLDLFDPLQADREADGLGDLCDVCPNVVNPAQAEAIACIAATPDGGTCFETTIDLPVESTTGEISILSLEKTAPTSIDFEVNSTSCEVVVPMEFLLNGTRIATFLDASLNCECAPPTQYVSATDATLLVSLWNGDGNNVISIRKGGVPSPPATFHGTFIGWVRAGINAPGAVASECLYSFGGTCSDRDQCVSGSTEAAIQVDTALPHPLFKETLWTTEPFSNAALPPRIDISAIPPGDIRVCVAGHKTPRLYGASAFGDLFEINTSDARTASIGTVPSGVEEIEFDGQRSMVIAQVNGPPPRMAWFDPLDGHAVGAAVPNDGPYSSLEYVGTALYGTPVVPIGGQSELRIVTPASGGSTRVGPTGRGRISGLAYNNTTGIMYGIDQAPPFTALLRLDLASGAAIPIGPTGFVAGSLSFGPDCALYGGGTGVDGGKLFKIDTVTGRSSFVGLTAYSSIAGMMLGDPLFKDCRDFVKHDEEMMTINGTPCNSTPTALAGSDVEVECSSPAGAAVTLDGAGSTDPDSTPGTHDDLASFEWYEDLGAPNQRLMGTGERLSTTLPIGAHRVSLEVTDRFGAIDTDDLLIRVVDTRPPDLSVTADPETLWPPNHRMVPITITIVARDVCDTNPAIILTSVSSNEPDDAPGAHDGNTTEDIQQKPTGGNASELLLRAERDGNGFGRLYQITYATSDASQNTSVRSTGVLVPHDPGGKVEPIQVVMVGSGGGTSPTLTWSSVPGASSYNIIEGSLSTVEAIASLTVLSKITCLGKGITGTSLPGTALGEDPPPGTANFFLVESYDGEFSGYGTESGSREVFIKSGDSCR